MSYPTFEEQVAAYKELSSQISELEGKKRELGTSIFAQMGEKKLSVGKYIVRRYERLSFKVPLEEARQFGATKMEEVLDKDVLKTLHESGRSIPGISTSCFIQVSQQKEELLTHPSDG